MMAGLSVAKIKDTVDGVFPLKTFCLSLALLMLALIGTVGIYQALFAKPVVAPELTGKTIAVAEVAKKIEEQPIQTVPDPEPAPKVDEHALIENPPETPPPKTEEKKAVAEPAPEAPIAVEDSIAGLYQSTPSGPLPIVRESDGLNSFDAYKAPFKLKADTKAVISLVMVDYGLSDKLAKNAIETLPAATTFVASPYSNNLQAKITGARSKGMEIWMGLPMQGTENSEPVNMGPNAILTGLNVKENVARLNTHLGRATGYVGVATDIIPTYSKSAEELHSLMNAIATRGLGIAQLEPKDDIIPIASTSTGAPFIKADMWLDTVMTKQAMQATLAALEKVSLYNGHAVVVFHPSLLASSTIAEWQKSLAAKNIQIAPLTYAVHLANNEPQKPSAAADTKTTEPAKTEQPSHGTAAH